MQPADFYSLVIHDRRRAARHLLCYDACGLRQFATDCAQYLGDRFGVQLPADHVLSAWQRVALIGEAHATEALGRREHSLGE